MRAYLGDLLWGLWTLARALALTLRYLGRPAITVQYPDERRPQPLRALNRHVLTTDPHTGQLKCTACDACARICPTRCIELTGAGKGKERRAATFAIDHNLCMYCNLCVEVCPFDAITMWTRIGELAAYTRSGLVYDLPTMRADRFYPSPMTPEPPPPAPRAAPGVGAS
jgi:formate hydrogenlyase subunit 6/NADH:ubiquinone oxidoreductase subunit I